MTEDITKLEKEAEEMQEHLDEMKERIAEMKEKKAFKFKVGKFYRGGNTIIYCISSVGVDKDCFSGINIKSGPNSMTDDGWVKKYFTQEVTPTWEEV